MHQSKAVDLCIADWTDNQREITDYLRSILLRSAPGIEENVNYFVPHYNYFGPLCYISPVKGTIKLGFAKGYLMSNQQGILESNELKQVRHYLIERSTDIRELELRQTIQEALMINEELDKKKKLRRR